ncbi:trigger factor [Bacillus horti]|uniref:Trigger factor n=1 Tax=Caldalkalibacillus horti TaxID=77523 RepID=A0ABT9VTN4_9BACI|nr:trigger factor [Bacillus horti]MDQ0164338.1 trigger factor [Bacillus horti]
MSAKWEKLENNQGVLTIEVAPEKLEDALDKAFKKVVGKVNVPGFRKGKVPRKIFEARFGVESLYQDALDILLPEAYSSAIDETGIEPVDRPEVDVEQIERGQTLIVKATVTVKPEVTLGEYKGLEIPEKDFSVKDEDLNEELNKIRDRQAELTVIEDGTVEQGDTAVIDFEGFLGEEAFEGGKGENYSLEIGSNSFIPGFEDQLVGAKKSEEKEIKVTFPEDYHSEELKGKEATFKVTVHEIKRKQLPELDDEFAKDVSEFETLDEYKADLLKKLEEKAKEEEDAYKKDTVIKQAAENATIDIPAAMIETEIEQMSKEFEQRLQMQGMNLDLYFQFSGLDKEGLREQFKGDAEQRVVVNLTLEAIANTENIEVSDEEVEEELTKMSSMYGLEVDELKQRLGSQLDGLKADVRIRKAVDLLVQNSKTVA